MQLKRAWLQVAYEEAALASSHMDSRHARKSDWAKAFVAPLHALAAQSYSSN
jgi:hypothetical protein